MTNSNTNSRIENHSLRDFHTVCISAAAGRSISAAMRFRWMCWILLDRCLRYGLTMHTTDGQRALSTMFTRFSRGERAAGTRGREMSRGHLRTGNVTVRGMGRGRVNVILRCAVQGGHTVGETVSFLADGRRPRAQGTRTRVGRSTRPTATVVVS